MLAWQIVSAGPLAQAEPEGPNSVTEIQVSRDGDAREVRITTAQAPTFTVFRLSDPMRVVVDISGGDLAQLDGPLVVEDGVIGQIATRQFNTDGFVMGRIIVGFERAVTYHVNAEGNAVVVSTGNMTLRRIDRPTPPPVAPIDRAAAERFEAAKAEAEKAAEQAQAERAAAEEAARWAAQQKQEAQALAETARRLKTEAEQAQTEAQTRQQQARDALARDRSEAEKAAALAERRLLEVRREAASAAEAQAEADRLALEAEQQKREAEELATRAEASHKRQLAQLGQEMARAQAAKSEAEAARAAAQQAQAEAEEAEAAAKEAKEALEARRAALATELAQADGRARQAARLRQEAETALAGLSEERRAVEATRRELAEQQQALRASREEISQQRRALGTRQQEVSTLAQKLQKQAQQLQNEAEQVAQDRAQLQQRRRALRSRTESTREGQAQAEKLEAREARLRQAQRKLTQDRQSLRAERQRLQKQRQALQVRRQRLDRRERQQRKASKRTPASEPTAPSVVTASAVLPMPAMAPIPRKEPETNVSSSTSRASSTPETPPLRTLQGAQPYRPPVLTGVQAGQQISGVLLAIEGKAPSFQVLRVDDPPRLVVDMVRTKRGVRRLTHGVRHPFVRRVRLGDHEHATRAVFDLTHARAEHDVREVPEGLLVHLREPPPNTATPPTPSLSAPPAATATVAKAANSFEVRDLRFEGDPSQARIVMEVPPEVQTRVDDRSSKAWVLELANARLPKKLEKALDTSAYGSVVRLVSAYQAEKQPPAVKIVANLTGPASQRVQRQQNALVWEIVGSPRQANPDVPATPRRRPTVAARGGALPASQALARSTTAQARPASKRRISIDLQDAELVNVLRLLADVSGENIVASDEIKGKITLKLRNVPWDTALETILKTKGYDKVRKNNILRIAPAEQIQREQELALAKKKAQLEVEDTVIKIITINYATASEIVNQVKPMLTARGTVQVDARTNTIIIEDIRSNINRIVQLTQRLDKQTPQVLIEARIVEASSNFLEQLGIQWGGVGQATAATGNPTGLQFPGDVVVQGAADDPNQNANTGTGDPSRFAVNLPAPIGSGQGGGIGFIFGSAGGSQVINLRLTALENSGEGRIISSPRITTLDNRKATIEQGVDIPISVVSAAGVNTRFVPAVLSLEVNPHVTNDGSVLMEIKVSKNEPDFVNTGAAGDPTIVRKFAETEVLVRDGETTVIGGIYTRNRSENFAKVPLLGDIPVIGWLFKNRRKTDTRSELLVFITPHIVNRQAALVGGTGADADFRPEGS